MHWLLLDAGNSALKWALATPDGALATDAGVQTIAPAMQAALAGEWRSRAARAVAAAFGCSVAGGEPVRAVEEAAMQAYGVRVHWFDSQATFAFGALQLDNGYRSAQQLGADRWHAMLAARAAHPARALVVVNAGTATTVDCVTMDGRFVGGVIAPGVQLMHASLARGTAHLPLAEGELVAHPDNTDDAIASGVLESQLGLIERRVRRFASEQGPVLLVLAGGLARKLQPHIAIDAVIAQVALEHNLVLRGVQIRARALAQAANPAQ